jgi:hypothetical protein
MRQLERDRLRARGKGQTEETTELFTGFGKRGAVDEDAWEQWVDFVLFVNEGSPDSDEDEDEPSRPMRRIEIERDDDDDIDRFG